MYHTTTLYFNNATITLVISSVKIAFKIIFMHRHIYVASSLYPAILHLIFTPVYFQLNKLRHPDPLMITILQINRTLRVNRNSYKNNFYKRKNVSSLCPYSVVSGTQFVCFNLRCSAFDQLTGQEYMISLYNQIDALFHFAAVGEVFASEVQIAASTLGFKNCSIFRVVQDSYCHAITRTCCWRRRPLALLQRGSTENR